MRLSLVYTSLVLSLATASPLETREPGASGVGAFYYDSKDCSGAAKFSKTFDVDRYGSCFSDPWAGSIAPANSYGCEFTTWTAADCWGTELKKTGKNGCIVGPIVSFR